MAVKAIGARGNVSSVDRTMEATREFERQYGCTVQMFRADRIFGALHLEVAAEHAERAFEQGRNRSKNMGTEILLYAAAEKQIKNAIEKLGITAETGEMAILIVGDAPADELLSSLGFTRDDSVLEGEKDRGAFGIGDVEIGRVGHDRIIDLILEKMALSELER